MGNFMIPVCCICGKASKKWHDPDWENAGGLQDFCPQHAMDIQNKYGELRGYLVPHMQEMKCELGGEVKIFEKAVHAITVLIDQSERTFEKAQDTQDYNQMARSDYYSRGLRSALAIIEECYREGIK